jgi:hypothetical protein
MLRKQEFGMNEPFVLRSPNGPHKGEYLVNVNYEGIEWTNDVNRAKRFNLQDAYSNVAACIDMLCQAVVPENVGGATEEECREFGRIAANDMFASPSDAMIAMLSERAVRRSTNQPLYELPNDMIPPKHDPHYMSVWEWVGRAVYRGEQKDGSLARPS